ncbi:MAG: DUF3006 domain-containing protein [Anaerolineae bacterium]|jgi:hypothetical protein|nr:DUF3006 domain-containing protein [Anaerolineae bacterium]MDH7473804.1 DUF3006 domain-containing protein [Anaerolineae bacterium]
MLRGVVDSLEEDWAIVVLDDGQRLDWPRENLPPDVHAGMAVVLDVASAQATAAAVGGGVWVGKVGRRKKAAAQAAGVPIHLGDQTLHWPEKGALKAGQPVAVCMAVDEADTTARRQRVRSLLDDIFG